MKKGKRLLALFLAAVLFSSSNNYLFQVMAEETEIVEESGNNPEVVNPEITGNNETGDELTEGGGTEPEVISEPESTEPTEPTELTEPAEPETSTFMMGLEGEDDPEEPESVDGGASAFAAKVIEMREGVAYGEGQDSIETETGKSFTYEMQYNYVSTGGSVVVDNPYIDIDFGTVRPRNIGTVDVPAYATGEGIEWEEFINSNTLRIYLKAQNTGYAASIRVIFDTDNFITPSGTVVDGDLYNPYHVTPSLHYELIGTEHHYEPELYPTVTLSANDAWTIDKNIVDDKNELVKEANGQLGTDSFTAQYELAVKGNFGETDNAPGRRSITSYVIEDQITDYKTDGEVIDIKNIQISSGAGFRALDPSEYEIVKDANNIITGIKFFTFETYATDDNYIKAGEMKNTVYKYTVEYKADAYVVDGSEDPVYHTVNNNATLSYTLVGDVAGGNSSAAAVVLGGNKDKYQRNDVEINKFIQFGEDAKLPLNTVNKDKYRTGAVKFKLTNENGTAARKADGQPYGDLEVGADGSITISGLIVGNTYQLEEIIAGNSSLKQPPSEKIQFKVPAPGDPVVLVKDGGYSVTVSEDEKGLDVINTVENTSGVEFVKKGIGASGGEAVALKGVVFAIKNEDNEAVATSDENGNVIFWDVVPGTYDIYEVSLNPTGKLADYEKIDAGTKKGSIDYDKAKLILEDYVVKGGKINRPSGTAGGWSGNVYTNVSKKGYVEFVKKDNKGQVIQSTSGTKGVFKLYGILTSAQTEELTDAELGKISVEEFKALATKNGWKTIDLTFDATAKKYKPSGAIKEGTYVILEEQAPVGYKIEGNGLKKVVVENGKTNNFEMKNTTLQRVRFVKSGEHFKEAVNGLTHFNGVTFEIYKANKANPDLKDEDNFTKIDSAVISKEDVSGRAISDIVYLEEGTYYYKETVGDAKGLFKTIDGFKSFTVNNQDSEIEVSVKNESNAAKIKIIKKDDADKTTPLGGAGYNVYLSTDTQFSKPLNASLLVTDENGVVETGLLEAGKDYVVREMTPPQGYELASDTIKVENLTVDTTREITFYNKKLHNLTVLKYKMGTDTLIDTATFTLKKGTASDSLKKTSKGTFVRENVVNGESYTVKETKAPTGYVGYKEEITFEIGTDKNDPDGNWEFDGDTNVLKVYNKPVSSVEISKYHNFDEAEYALLTNKAVTFALYVKEDGEYKLAKDINSKSLTGNTSNGKITFGNLDPDKTYYIKETLTPELAKLYELESIKLKSEGGETEIAPKDGYYPFVATSGKKIEISAYNKAIKSKVKLRKVSMPSNTKLVGVKFVLEKYNTETDKFEAVEEGTTNGNGTIEFNALLEKGRYRFVETVPKDHVNGDSRGTSTFDANGKETVTYDEFVIDDSNIGKTLSNYVGDNSIKNNKRGKLIVHKVGRYKGLADQFVDFDLKDVEFSLYEAGELSAAEFKTKYKNSDSSLVLVGTFKTGENGKASLDNIKPGDYYLVETKGHEDFKLLENPIQITIESGETKTEKVVNEPEKGIIYVEKVDSQFNLITSKAAQFEVYKKVKESDGYDTTITGAGEETIYLKKDTNASPSTTQKDGSIIETSYSRDKNGKLVGNVHCGIGYTLPLEVGETYYLKEIKAPDNYEIINEWTGPITIQEGRNDVQVVNQAKGGPGGGGLGENEVRLQVKKITNLPGEGDVSKEVPVKGVKYYVYKVLDESAVAELSDRITNADLASGRFALVASGYTEKDGFFSSVLLQKNTQYVVREAEASEYDSSSVGSNGNELVDVTSGDVRVGAVTTKGKNWAIVNVGEPSEGTITVYPKAGEEVTYVNPPKMGEFALKKAVNGNATTQKFTFKLYRQAKPEGSTTPDNSKWGDVYKTYSVGVNETILSGELSTDYIYKLVETVPAGYYFEANGTTNVLERVFTLENGKIIGLNAQGEYEAFDTVSAAKASPITYTNSEKAVLNIEKFGSYIGEDGVMVTNHKLNDVVFKIYTDAAYTNEIDYSKVELVSQRGTIVANGIQANSTGRISIKLEKGTYYISEYSVGSGSEKLGFVSPATNSVVTEQTLEYGQKTEWVRFDNVSTYGRFKALKTDAYTPNRVLGGATFTLGTMDNDTFKEYKVDNKAVTYTSKDGGIVVSGLLPEGDYYLKETGAPGVKDEYTGGEVFGPFNVVKGELKDYTSNPMKNWKNFQIKVIKKSSKQDNVDQILLGGAKFELYDKPATDSARKAIATGTTVKGILTFDVLLNLESSDNAERTFYVKEIEAPKGYVMQDREFEVKVTADAIKASGKVVAIEKEIENVVIPTIQLTKVGDLEGDTDGLEGVTFTLYEVGDNGKVITTESTSKKTGKDGVAKFNELDSKALKDGKWYAVKETAVPAEYSKNFNPSNAPYFYFQAENDKTVTTYYTKVKVVDGKIVGDSEESTASVENKSGTVRLSVITKDGNAARDAAGETLTNLTSSCYAILKKDANGNYVPYNAKNFKDLGSKVSSGWFQVGASGFNSDFLLYEGDYKLVKLSNDMTDAEKAGLEDVLADIKAKKGDLTIYGKAASGDTVLFEATKESEEAMTFTVTKDAIEDGTNISKVYYNDPLGSLTVTKYGYYDHDGEKLNKVELPNVGFTFKKGQDSITDTKGDGKTDNDGMIKYELLSHGAYKLTETSLPEDSKYKMNQEAEAGIDLSVGMKDDKVVLLSELTTSEDITAYLDRTQEVYNPSIKGKLRIIKTDANDAIIPLAGDEQIVFEIYKIVDGKPAAKASGKVVIDKDNYSESKDGIFSELLDEGSYVIKETETKAGYKLHEGFIQDALGNNLVVELKPCQDEKTIKDKNINTATVKNTRYGGYDSKPAINKYVVEDGQISLTDQDNLLNDKGDDLTVDFVINDYAIGDNDYELKEFTVIDDGITFYDEQKIKGGNKVEFTEDSDGKIKDFVINSVTLAKAENQDGSAATATVYYAKTKTGAEFDWIAKATNVSLEDVSTVTIGDNARAIKIVYGNTKEGFKTDGYTMNVTFVNRSKWSKDELSSKNPILRIENTAKVNYREMIYNAVSEAGPVYLNDKVDGKAGIVKAATSGQPYIEFKEPDSKRALAEIYTSIVSADKEFTAGDSINYKIDVKVDKDSPTTLDQPVVAFRMPLDTVLIKDSNSSNIKVVIRDKDGRILSEPSENSVYTVTEQSQYKGEDIKAIYNIESLTYQEKTGSSTKQYILQFNDTVKMNPGDYMEITFTGKISNDEKAVNDSLILVGYLGSNHTLVPSGRNPHGTSFTSSEGRDLLVNDMIHSAINTGAVEYLNRAVAAGLKNSSNVKYAKYIGKSQEELDKGQNYNLTVSPGDTIYYKLVAYNNSNTKMTNVRLLDTLPVKGDTMVLTDAERGTNIGNKKVEIVDVILPEFTTKGVKVASQKVYGYDAAAKPKTTMLMKTEDSWTTNGFADYTNDLSSLGDASAVGFDIAFNEDATFNQGDSYAVYIGVQIPDIKASEIEDYLGKQLRNSVAGASFRKVEGDADKEIGADNRSEPDPVTAMIDLGNGAITGVVWEDVDGNGLNEEGVDKKIENAQVDLYKTEYYKSPNGKETIKTVTKVTNGLNQNSMPYITGADGRYLFENLEVSKLKVTSSDKFYSTNPEDYIGNRYITYHIEVSKVDESLTATHRQIGNKNGEAADAYANNHQKTDDSDITFGGVSPEIQLYYEDVDKKVVGETRKDIDAGYTEAYAIGDYVWIDNNANGLQDAGEPGLNGVRVNLYTVDEKGEVSKKAIDSTTTTGNGAYKFNKLCRGQYVVEFDVSEFYRDPVANTEDVSKYIFTTPNVGEDDEKDSDAEIKTSSDQIMRSHVIDLTPERLKGVTEDLSIDAGLVEYSALGGYAFDDMDYDDLQKDDARYVPLLGTKVTLYELDGDKIGAKVAETTVDEKGYYFFDKLQMDKDSKDYTVLFEIPDEYKLVSPNKDSDDGAEFAGAIQPGAKDSNIDSDAIQGSKDNEARIKRINLPKGMTSTTWCVGARKISTVGDYVWNDVNKDGYQDDAETGVQDIPVVLQYREKLDADKWGEWKTKARTTTDADGHYEFTDVESSSEYVREFRVVFEFEERTRVTKLNAQTNEAGEAVTAETDSDMNTEYSANVIDGNKGGYVTRAFTLDYGQTDMTWDAGIFYPISEIRGVAWFDADFNGKREESEVKLPNVIATLERYRMGASKMAMTAAEDSSAADSMLDDGNWEEVTSMKTGADGKYEFLGLDADNYRIKFTYPEGYTATRYNNVFTDGGDKVDSDASKRTSDTHVFYSKLFYLEEDDKVEDIDAGAYAPKNTVIPEEKTVTEYNEVKKSIPNEVTKYEQGEKTTHVTTRTNAASRSVVKTGDNSNILLWVLTLATSMAIIVGVGGVTKQRKKRKSKDNS